MKKRKYADDEVLAMVRKVRAGTSSMLLLGLCDAAEERSNDPAKQSADRQAYMRKYMRKYRKGRVRKKNARAPAVAPASAPQNDAKRPKKRQESQKTEPIGGLVLGELKF